MKSFHIAAFLLILPLLAYGGRRNEDLIEATTTAKTADEQLRTNPALTSEQRTEQQQIKAGAVEKIETIGNEEAADPHTQIDVSKSLVTVSEAPRAIPYAERGLALAEKSGDPKLVREALLTGADVYYRAGNYDLSRQRAERILKQNPQDKDALMLYMQVKGRAAPAAGGQKVRSEKPDTHSVEPGNDRPQRSDRPDPALTMTSPAALESKRLVDLGRSRMALDPASALKHFDAAVAADPANPVAKAARARARLAAGDAAGALQNAEDAVAANPSYAEALATRAEAKRALGRAEAEVLADYEEAARLDPEQFRSAYEELVAKAASGGALAGGSATDGSPGTAKDDGAAGSLTDPPGGLQRYALIGVFAGGLGCTIAALLLRRRRSDEDGSPQG